MVPFFTSNYKYSFSSGVGYVMRPILLIMWTAFQSFILRDNNNLFLIKKFLLTTMLTIKIIFTINSPKKRKNYSFRNTE